MTENGQFDHVTAKASIKGRRDLPVSIKPTCLFGQITCFVLSNLLSWLCAISFFGHLEFVHEQALEKDEHFSLLSSLVYRAENCIEKKKHKLKCHLS